MSKVPMCQSVEEVARFLEALYYEQKIRLTEKNKNVDKLRGCLDKQATSFHRAESIIKRSNLPFLSLVSYEIKLFKQLGDIKNLRQSGLYLDKDVLKKSEDSEIYDWIVDIDLITNVQ